MIERIAGPIVKAILPEDGMFSDEVYEQFEPRDNWVLPAIERLDHARAKTREARESAFPKHSEYAIRLIDESIEDLEAAKEALEASVE